MSDSLRPHGLQHARLPCPSPSPRAFSNSCSLSHWCHPTISSSVIPFSSWPHSLPASGAFSMSWLFTSGGQSIGASASTSVLPMNVQDWSPLEWDGWISLQFKGLSRVFWEKHHSLKASVLWHSTFFMVQLSYLYITARKTVALTERTFAGKVKSLLFNMLSRFVIAFVEIEATATIFKHRLSFRRGCLLSMLISPFPHCVIPQSSFSFPEFS